jgi:hypothetical protein
LVCFAAALRAADDRADASLVAAGFADTTGFDCGRFTTT